MVGDDAFGSFVAEDAAKHGVDASAVIRNKKYSTSTSIVLIEDIGERHFAYYGESNDALTADDILKCDLKKYKHLHIGSAMALKSLDGDGLCEVLKQAKSMNITTSLDITWDSEGIWLGKIKTALFYCDYFLPSLEEAKKISGLEKVGEMKEYFSQFNIKKLIVKMGEDGSFATDFINDYYTPIIKKGIAVDTTGAGDCYAAGFLCASYYGLDLQKSTLFATAVASDCVIEYGANTGVKSLNETLDYLVRENKFSQDDVRVFSNKNR
jgi:sugar/nucleoside kinase (ribokinase family)